MKKQNILLLLLLLLHISNYVIAKDVYTRIPGTKFKLLVPEKFIVAKDFAGIIIRETATSVHLVELPTDRKSMERGLTKENLAKKGMNLIKSEKVQSEIGKATLLHVTQSAQGREFRKWMLIGGTNKSALLLTATVPVTLADDMKNILKNVLLTALWDPKMSVDPLEGSGFTVKETKDLKISQAIMGGSLLLTKNGIKKRQNLTDPFMIIGQGTSEKGISDLVAFSKYYLNNIKDLSKIKIKKQEDLSIASMPACGLTAEAVYHGIKVMVYLAIAYNGTHHYILRGVTGIKGSKVYLKQFRIIVNSFTLKEKRL